MENSRLINTFCRLPVHSHVCSIYESPADQVRGLGAYMKQGIEQGERCLWAFDENTLGEVRGALEEAGVSVGAAVDSGALRIVSKRETYLRDGSFDPDRMLALWGQIMDEALRDGYRGVRVTGETSWLLSDPLTAERFMEYESKVNRFFQDRPATAICQYNEKRFPPERLVDVLYTHPTVIYRGTACRNHFYIPTEQYLSRRNPREDVERLLNDILARERYEQSLRDANRRLARSNQELEHLAYIASHDLKEPLRVIANHVQLLARREEARLDARSRQSMAFITDNTRRMYDLLEGLLAYVNAGRDLRRGRVDLGECARRAVAALKAEFPDAASRVSIGTLPVVDGDRSLLTDLFRHLLSNALKFHGERPSRVWVSSEAGDGEHVVDVTDDGMGIDPEHFDRIFQIYQRLHAPDRYGGMGLGLPLSWRIVEKHGGELTLESTPGAGSRFRFTLPVEAAP